MPTRDSTQTTGVLHQLRQRWFAASRPMAVDDEGHWLPATDPGPSPALDGEADATTTTAKP